MDSIAAAVERAIVAEPARTELAAAKINLALHVGARRSDGYHQVETLVVFADYGDIVSAAPGAATGGVTIKGPFGRALAGGTTSTDNLAVRAAVELRKAAGKRVIAQTKLVLTKRIPIASGLGGGSADAAAVLRLLNREWGLDLTNARLDEIGLKLGADVPMCLASYPLVATGIGETIRAVSGMPAIPIVLAHPGEAVATASVFAALKPAERGPLPPLPNRFHSLLDVIFWLKKARNDLAEPAAAVSPIAVAAARALMSDAECLFARMTGSGAAAFGIFTTMDAAERAAGRLRQSKPGWWVVPAKTGAS